MLLLLIFHCGKKISLRIFRDLSSGCDNMEYSPSRNGEEGLFLFGEDEVDITFETAKGQPFAEIVDALLCMKALNEYFVKEEAVTDRQAQQEYKGKVAICRGHYERFFIRHTIAPLPLADVTQENLITAYRNKDVELIARLCAGIAQE